MRLDVDRLAGDIKRYERALVTVDHWLRKRLEAPKLNLDAPADVAVALKASGMVEAFRKTPTGKDSTSRKNLTLDMFEDPTVFWALGYRGRLETVLANSMRPWLAAVDAKNMIHTSWNQVRSTDTGGAKGTRTGRLSCSRFMNIAKAWEGFRQPVIKGLPALPLVRRYILPDEGQLIYHRDYSQQELRCLAHFEDDVLLAEYQKNPRIDFHTKTQELVKRATGMEISRHTTKTVVFGLIYGMGAGLLAEKLGVTVEEAVALRKAVKSTLPGVAALDRSLKELGKAGQPIRTWGGRQYLPEPPKMVNGAMRDFSYKLLNVLVQGSSADCTKEAIIRYHQHPKKRGRMLVTVHDEVNVSGPSAEETEVLRECMEGIEFDVPMLTEGKCGPNWGDLK
jgi:DNA polymerase-1